MDAKTLLKGTLATAVPVVATAVNSTSGESVIKAIATVGFPIVMCLVLMWYVKDTSDKNRKDINELNKQHMEEMQSVISAINNNTLAFQKLYDRLEVIVDGNGNSE